MYASRATKAGPRDQDFPESPGSACGKAQRNVVWPNLSRSCPGTLVLLSSYSAAMLASCHVALAQCRVMPYCGDVKVPCVIYQVTPPVCFMEIYITPRPAEYFSSIYPAVRESIRKRCVKKCRITAVSRHFAARSGTAAQGARHIPRCDEHPLVITQRRAALTNPTSLRPTMSRDARRGAGPGRCARSASGCARGTRHPRPAAGRRRIRAAAAGHGDRVRAAAGRHGLLFFPPFPRPLSLPTFGKREREGE